MTIGSILLAASAVLVLLGVGQRVLDKMRLSDRAALILIAAMFVGGLIPDIRLGLVRINIGGALIPLGVCVYLLVSADEAAERVRGILGALITAGVVYLLSRVMPSEPENIILDPVYACGVAGGIVGYVLGRSRRGAFISGVMGVLLGRSDYRHRGMGGRRIAAIDAGWRGNLRHGGHQRHHRRAAGRDHRRDIGARGAGQRRCAQPCPRTYAAKGER